MINKSNFKNVIQSIGFIQSSIPEIYEKKYTAFDYVIRINFNTETIDYPSGESGIRLGDKTTSNFSHPENFVVLECVNRLLEKGYRPEHIELEKKWVLGHEEKGGKADICVHSPDGKMLFIIECKTHGKEFKKEYTKTYADGGQLFSYWQQEGSTKWLVIYSSEFSNGIVTYATDSIDCSDDANILALSKKDSSIATYSNAHTANELHSVWVETYDRRFCGDVIFRDDSQAYQIGIKPLRKQDLRDFSENDKIVNRFEEVLRHNNVSDKENAFNRLVALFICKLVDEIQKADTDVVDFQYKLGTDTYESLQDRLQRLHKEGMEKFMREEIFYVPDDYAEALVQQYTGQKRQKMIAELKKTLRILKFYTNNDFTFKDVHNEELFYQNGKILVEVVQIFQQYRIIGSNDLQMLGDLFEQLLNKGFKQNEGQFFTPIPITRFIWDSLPVKKIMQKDDGFNYPKIIDYACGAGHFLTEGFESVNACILTIDPEAQIDPSWVEKNIYGIEKDYRLARVSKISLFMHGAGDGNIIFGDGLENYPDKNIAPNSFDILVANPPYSVAAFKPHLKLKENALSILETISNSGSEIETLFIERIAQLLKPQGIAAVILPSSILNKENESFVAARENLLCNFNIRAIVQLGNKTFGATGTNTVVLFLEKFNEPPKRIDLVADSVAAIFDNNELDDWEDRTILDGYLEKIGVDIDTYRIFIGEDVNYTEWETNPYFKMYVQAYLMSSEVAAKTKQKGFQKASIEEKAKWLNQHFYLFAKRIESKKLKYFALVYLQNTLVVTAPDGNKEQETFLGYKWSNRKGQEGIQIITPGGVLYNGKNRSDESVLAGIIRNAFMGNVCSVPELNSYYYYLRLQDMIDFGNVSFSNSIKTTKTRVPRTGDGWTLYKLSDDKIFDVYIGDRVLSTDVVENGKYPIYSANVFEEFGRTDKQNLTDFSTSSVLWGIDGDWMVNCIPADTPFYPTDHCGVLRVNSDQILPNYMALALQIEGEYERFSRHNRASVQRIKNLMVSIPPLPIQEEVVTKANSIEEALAKNREQSTALQKNLRKKFVDTFGNTFDQTNISQHAPLGSMCENLDNMRKPVASHKRNRGSVPYYGASGIVDYVDGYLFNECLLLVSEDGANLVARKTPIAFEIKGKTWVNNHAHVLKFSDYRLQKYVECFLNGLDLSPFVNKKANPKLTKENLESIPIPVPNDDALNTFFKYAESMKTLQEKLLSQHDKLQISKEDLFSKYLRY